MKVSNFGSILNIKKNKSKSKIDTKKMMQKNIIKPCHYIIITITTIIIIVVIIIKIKSI